MKDEVSPHDYTNPKGAWKSAVKQNLTTDSLREYTMKLEQARLEKLPSVRRGGKKFVGNIDNFIFPNC